jgi:hypothetical protein
MINAPQIASIVTTSERPNCQRTPGFAKKTGEARQAAAGHHRHDHHGADEGQPPQQSAHLIHVQRLEFVPQIAAQGKVRAARKPWATITTTVPVKPIKLMLAMPKKAKPTWATLELPMSMIQVALAHGHRAAQDHVAQAEGRDDVSPALRLVGHQRQGDAEQAVEAEFFEHAGVNHGRARRSRAVTQRRPGVEWIERNQDAEADQEQGKNPVFGPRNAWGAL